jgi:hypothetical protein
MRPAEPEQQLATGLVGAELLFHFRQGAGVGAGDWGTEQGGGGARGWERGAGIDMRGVRERASPGDAWGWFIGEATGEAFAGEAGARGRISGGGDEDELNKVVVETMHIRLLAKNPKLRIKMKNLDSCNRISQVNQAVLQYYRIALVACAILIFHPGELNAGLLASFQPHRKLKYSLSDTWLVIGKQRIGFVESAHYNQIDHENGLVPGISVDHPSIETSSSKTSGNGRNDNGQDGDFELSWIHWVYYAVIAAVVGAISGLSAAIVMYRSPSDSMPPPFPGQPRSREKPDKN